ncbi:MAG: conjugal transfer protein TraC, partial [Atopobiaceae bacterium]|nr:conjugal transfer protein TraC [Atopobiaceae bacterium]
IDKAKAVSMVKRQAAWLQKEVIDNQRKALNQGFDMTILPPELEETRSENERVLDQILHANQRLYYFCGLVFTWARTREALDDQVVQLVRTAHSEGIELGTLDLRQREGLNSVLPLAHNHVDVVRDLTTTEATVLMPFTTQELDMTGGGYYGQNQISGNLVICNRKRLMSPHGFVCGMSGSGKSFSVKREIENTILSAPGDEIYIMDVTGEYSYQVARNHGVELAFGPDSANHMNPLDMADAEGLSHQAAFAWKIDALLAMTSALKAEGGQDLTQEERSIVSACVEETYRACAGGPAPVLGDFVDRLKATQGAGRAEAQRLALVFGRYVSGPMGFLNHRSDVAFGKSKLTNFNTKDVPADMRVFTMLANLESVRQRMFQNHERGVATWLYIDEIQSLFGHPAIIAYLARLWREGRKFGLICTGMTQSASAMGAGGESAAIIDQSGFLFLLRQSDVDRAFWAKARTLSPQEEGYISETARRGQGLLIADAARVGITDDFPQGNDLYDMFSTSPEDYARRLERERGVRG